MKRLIGLLSLCAALSVLVGCGTSSGNCSGTVNLSCLADLRGTSVDQTATLDDLTTMSTMDQATPPDLMPPPHDFTAGICADAKDCRLFSSYCSNYPCVCFVLSKGDPNPPCEGVTVNCFMDPCNNKTAACEANDLGVNRCVML